MIFKSGDRRMLFGSDNTGDCIGEFRVGEPMRWQPWRPRYHLAESLVEDRDKT